MDVTRLEKCAYIKVAILWGRNARECHSELVEAVRDMHPVCYNGRAHSPLLKCLCTTSAILAGAHYYFVVSFKCEGKIVDMT